MFSRCLPLLLLLLKQICSVGPLCVTPIVKQLQQQRVQSASAQPATAAVVKKKMKLEKKYQLLSEFLRNVRKIE